MIGLTITGNTRRLGRITGSFLREIIPLEVGNRLTRINLCFQPLVPGICREFSQSFRRKTRRGGRPFEILEGTQERRPDANWGEQKHEVGATVWRNGTIFKKPAETALEPIEKKENYDIMDKKNIDVMEKHDDMMDGVHFESLNICDDKEVDMDDDCGLSGMHLERLSITEGAEAGDEIL